MCFGEIGIAVGVGEDDISDLARAAQGRRKKFFVRVDVTEEFPFLVTKDVAVL